MYSHENKCVSTRFYLRPLFSSDGSSHRQINARRTLQTMILRLRGLPSFRNVTKLRSFENARHYLRRVARTDYRKREHTLIEHRTRYWTSIASLFVKRAKERHARADIVTWWLFLMRENVLDMTAYSGYVGCGKKDFGHSRSFSLT